MSDLTTSKYKIDWSAVNKTIFIPPMIFLVLAVAAGAVWPEEFSRIGKAMLGSLTREFGWFFTLGVAFNFMICLYALFSKYGRIKLGGPAAKPIMSTVSWFTLSFTSAMAIGISFWGTAEPMLHFATPPKFLVGVEGGTIQAASYAIRFTYMHWGFVPFALYCGAGVVVCFAIQNMNLPYRCSSSLYSLIGERIHGPIGYIFEAFILFAIVGSISSSLGMGALQIGAGIQYAFGIPSTVTIAALIIGIMAFLYIVGACCKIEGFMRQLGNFNMILYFFLVLFVFFLGPTRSLIELIITGIGDYLQNLPTLLTHLDPFEQDTWTETWTSFYWPWWLAACPPTGLFLVKLAKGRTIRQFVMINMVAPACLGFFWFGTFGGAGMISDLFHGTAIGQAIVEYGRDAATYELMRTFPLPTFTIVITLVCAAISFNTKAQAVSYTLAGMTSHSSVKEPPKFLIIFWGGIMAVFTMILLLTGGRAAFASIQTASVVCGFPSAALMILMGVGFLFQMWNCKKYDKVGTFDHPLYTDIVADQIELEEEKREYPEEFKTTAPLSHNT